MPDEALYALALYIYSLKPPHNPNPVDANTEAGQKIFTREGCPRCPHAAAVYKQQAHSGQRFRSTQRTIVRD